MALVGREPAEAYARERRARAEEALLPFQRLNGDRANVTVSSYITKLACIFSAGRVCCLTDWKLLVAGAGGDGGGGRR